MKKMRLPIAMMVALTMVGCDLAVKEKDSLVVKTETGAFGGVDPAATLSAGYINLRDFGDQANVYALWEISSDELLCPTRGTDWGDNGVWRSTQQHTWDANSIHITNAWNIINQHIFLLNQLLDPASNASTLQAAEGKFLRAYNMYLLFDLFRQIPFRNAGDPANSLPSVMTGQAVIDYITKDLTDALAGLPHTPPAPNSGTIKASQASANFLMAKLYLNKHVFLGNATADPADMNKVIAAVDAIKADGYALETTKSYFEIFLPSDDTETILWTDTGNGNRMWCGLHYYQIAPDNTGGGWNGFATTADFYNLFDGPKDGINGQDGDNNAPGAGQEKRRGFVPQGNSKVGHALVGPEVSDDTYGFGYGFLIGQQFGYQYDDKNKQLVAYGKLSDRGGNPLIYSKDYPGLTGNDEKKGIRILKYNPSNGGFVNHEILFRYADAVLMKAEAILRGGTATSGDTPMTLVNGLRGNQARQAAPLASVGLQDILDERGRELYIEGWRRNDQIRFGTFTNIRQTMPNPDPNTVIYPIPTNALASNPNLKQNPGY